MAVAVPLITTLVSAGSAIYGANRASAAAKKGRDMIYSAPDRALASSKKFIDAYGQPTYGNPEFYGVGPEGWKAKSQAIFDQQMGLLQPRIDDEKRGIEQRMLAQGMPSSLMTEALRANQEKYAMGGQQAALAGTMAGIDLEAREAAGKTAFGLATADRGFAETAYGSNLAAGLVNPATAGGAAAGNFGMGASQQLGDYMSGFGSSVGSIWGDYLRYNPSSGGGSAQAGLFEQTPGEDRGGY